MSSMAMRLALLLFGAGDSSTGTGAVTIGPPSLDGTGSRTVPTFSGTGAVTIGAPTLSGSDTIDRTGTGAVTIGPPVLVGTGTYVPPDITATGAVTIGPPSLTGTGSFPNYSRIAFEGDSLTYGLRATSGGGTVTGTTYPARVMAALGAGWFGVNSGVSGALIAAMGGADGFYDAAAPQKIYVLMGGTNDLDGSASGATVEGRIITHLASHGHPIGYRVLVCVPPACGTFTAPKNAALAAYAALLRANWHSYADGLVDFLADPRLADPLDTTYFNVDTIHCNDTGYQVMADLVVAAVAALPTAASRRTRGRFGFALLGRLGL